jgi:hypothetical protein
VRTAKQTPRSVPMPKEAAKADAESIFKSYQSGADGRIQIRTVTHKAYLADLNASRYMASLPPSVMFTPHWRVAARQGYATAFLARLVELCNEADHGEAEGPGANPV